MNDKIEIDEINRGNSIGEKKPMKLNFLFKM